MKSCMVEQRAGVWKVQHIHKDKATDIMTTSISSIKAHITIFSITLSAFVVLPPGTDITLDAFLLK